MSFVQPDGYLAQPPTEAKGAVLVLHAWWGLNATIKALCDRLAAAGYTAFAPDLYHGSVADTIPGAEALTQALDFAAAQHEAADAAAFLAEHTGHASITVIGFSLGAAFAVALASALPDSVDNVVLFYGAGDADYTASKAAYLGHFAENDQYEEQAYIDAMEQGMRAAGRPVTFHVYPNTGHWFSEPDRTDVYDEAAATLAWERTLAFINGN